MSRTHSVRRRAGVVLAVLATSGLALVPVGTAQAAGVNTAKALLTDQYRAVGTSHIGSIDADLPIAKTKLLEKLNLKKLKIVGGTLAIAPQTVSFSEHGIPLRSTTTLTQASPITGTVRATKKGNVLKTKVSYTIGLSDVEANVPLLGWVPLGVGKDCQTIDPVVIAVSSPAGKYFDITKGGVVSGTYTIGDFQNCNLLNLPLGLGSIAINQTVPGSNNTVSLTLSHGKFVGKR